MQNVITPLYTYDSRPEISLQKMFCVRVNWLPSFRWSQFYSYHSYRHFREMRLCYPESWGTFLCRKIFFWCRDRTALTELEAKVLDIALMLHAEHGGEAQLVYHHVVLHIRNRYLFLEWQLLSALWRSRHGRANLKVQDMFADIKTHVKNWTDEAEVEACLCRSWIKPLIISVWSWNGSCRYYTLSDPIGDTEKFAHKLAQEKGSVEGICSLPGWWSDFGKPSCYGVRGKCLKMYCANVDFYSGFVYILCQASPRNCSPIFAIAPEFPDGALTVWKKSLTLADHPSYKYVGHHKGSSLLWCRTESLHGYLCMDEENDKTGIEKQNYFTVYWTDIRN